ncbi:MAG: ribonuclease D [Desulfamplus sp.]|nr:ribonuclease D [Desulfamplus sp.]
MIEYTLIDSDDELRRQCRKIEVHPKIAMDIEADSMHHYKERVCLIQIADPERHYLIDPLGIKDFSPLKPICENSGITKVFHGGDFDIRSIDRDFDIRIDNLFDTEIACRFLGIHKRSLAALLKKHFNLSMDKRFQKTDWSKRPLSKDMITYSINDVAYLLELANILEKKLRDSGRLEWAREEFELQSRVKYEKNGDEPLFLKFKGAGKMGRESLGVLESLLKMRDSIAENKNLPHFKIMGNDTLSALTQKRPVNIQQLRESGILTAKQVSMYGKACVDAVLEGMAIPGNSLPIYPSSRRPGNRPDMAGRINILKGIRASFSRNTGIETGFLMNNATINAVASANPKNTEELMQIKGTRKWQIELMGQRIIESLRI